MRAQAIPIMGGNDAVRELQQSVTSEALPILAPAAQALVSAREDGLEADIDDFLTKLIDAQKLRRALARHLASR